MPDSRPLNALRASLAAALRMRSGHHGPVWGDPKAMTTALKAVKLAFGGADSMEHPDREDLLEAVLRFHRDHQAATFTQLKYVCYGVTVPVGADGWRLIDRTPLFARLMALVDERSGQAKQFRRCYQGLIAGYFGFNHDTKNPAAAGSNWLSLRGFLGSRLAPVAEAARRRGREPEWLTTLAQHRNLLDDRPCVRYAVALRRGDRSELAEVCKGLGIERSSWVWHEAVMAYVHEVVKGDDAGFKSDLLKVLPLIDGRHDDLQLPATVALEAAALLVLRYADCAEKPEHDDLRDVCLRRIGNPWLERPAWDASVKSEPARRMVEGWLKRRLIKDFFELLAHDGAADVRRLNYWLKWEPRISEMWFVLGTDARNNRTKKFADVVARMAGYDRSLTNCPDHRNNAFVMRIGSLLVIEFGTTGNACYIFEASDFVTSLDKRGLSIHALKQVQHATRLSHAWQWEFKFDGDLGALLGEAAPAALPAALGAVQRVQEVDLAAADPPEGALRSNAPSAEPPTPGGGYRPSWSAFTPSAPAPARAKDRPEPPNREPDETLEQANRDAQSRTLIGDLDLHIRNLGMTVEDNRSKGGALWLRLPESRLPPGFAMQKLIESYGFRFAKGKGFYYEEPD